MSSPQSILTIIIIIGTSQVARWVKNKPAMQETQVGSLGQEDPLEEKMATHSSIIAWEIPWTEESGGLPSMRLQRVGHDRLNIHTDIYIIITSINSIRFLSLRSGWQCPPRAKNMPGGTLVLYWFGKANRCKTIGKNCP